MTKKILVTLLGLLFLSPNIFAAGVKDKNVKKETTKETKSHKTAELDSVHDNHAVDTQKIIEEYKSYVAGIDKTIRDEVISYRKQIAEINKKKRELYRTLSQEAQSFLIKEQEYRKKLPIGQKKLINLKEASEPEGNKDTNN